MSLFQLADVSKTQVREIALVGICTVPHARRVWDYASSASGAIPMVCLSSQLDQTSEARDLHLLTVDYVAPRSGPAREVVTNVELGPV